MRVMQPILYEGRKNRFISKFKSRKKEFICYTMDLTKKYIEINSDYRT